MFKALHFMSMSHLIVITNLSSSACSSCPPGRRIWWAGRGAGSSSSSPGPPDPDLARPDPTSGSETHRGTETRPRHRFSRIGNSELKGKHSLLLSTQEQAQLSEGGSWGVCMTVVRLRSRAIILQTQAHSGLPVAACRAERQTDTDYDVSLQIFRHFVRHTFF